MYQFQMRYLRFINVSCLNKLIWGAFFIGFSSCTTSLYQNLKPVLGGRSSIDKVRPPFQRALYKANIEITTHHLSGLLLIKKLPDSSTHLVFSNEMGLKFFDFEFRQNGNFKIFYIINQLNKKPVILTLRKDFELLLISEKNQTVTLKQDDHFLYYIYSEKKGFNCYITNKTGTDLLRAQRSSNKKPIVEAIFEGYQNGIPDSIYISHKNFKFNIKLKLIER